jgi:membrane protein required for colicin V production
MSLSFNFVDFLIVLVIGLSAGYAAWRGFISEAFAIIDWAASAFATLYFGPWLVPLARNIIATPWLGSLAAYAGVFLVVFIPLSFMSHRFSESVKNSFIGPLDRALGIAFGVVRGLVIVGVGYLLFTYFVPIPKQPVWLTQARLTPLMQSSAEVLISLVPSRDRADFSGTPQAEPAEKPKQDALGDLIQRENTQANKGSPEPAAAKKSAKTYGEKDRRALDTLLETTGKSGQ